MKRSQIFAKILKKTLDNRRKVCYNTDRKKRKGKTKMIKILNCSKYSLTCEYIVARWVDGDWWFYGAWNNLNRATGVALLERGQVFKTCEVEPEVWE